jgi:chitodextrinase
MRAATDASLHAAPSSSFPRKGYRVAFRVPRYEPHADAIAGRNVERLPAVHPPAAGKDPAVPARRFAAFLIAIAALALGSAVPADAARDRRPPTRPKNVRVVSKTSIAVTIAWARSRDNVRVAGYGMYRNGNRVGKTRATRYTFSGLAPETTYTFAVDAYDTSGNRSLTTSTGEVKTRPSAAPPRIKTLPVISGTAQEGQTLTATDGSWFGVPKLFGYQWLRCAGATCSNVSGASTKTYALATADVGATMRVRVTATNAFGSTSATSAETAVVTAIAAPPPPPPPSPTPVGYPASFFTGPLGMNNILPPKPGAFLGVWPQGTIAEQQLQIANREQFVGRRFDFIPVHHGAPAGACYQTAPFSQGREKWVADRGSMPIISWTHGWTLDQVNAGLADACLRDVGARFAAWGRPILLRIYWEFNGTWFPWSGTGAKFINAWKRTVDVMRSAGATNVGFVWCPDEGNFAGTNESYPGDAYVDWVASDRYNWSTSPWQTFQKLFSDPWSGAAQIHDKYGPVKPYMVAETGSVEDPLTPGRKAQWHRDALAAIKLRFPSLRGFVYFDVDMTRGYGVNWRLDTSQSSLEGFRDMALDPHFNTRG